MFFPGLAGYKMAGWYDMPLAKTDLAVYLK